MQNNNRRLQSELLNAFEALVCDYGFLRIEALNRFGNRAECLRSDFIEEYLDGRGEHGLIEDVRQANEELAKAESNLQEFGFAIDAEEHLIYNGTKKSIRAQIEKKMTQQIGTQDDLVKRFENAEKKLSKVKTITQVSSVLANLLAQLEEK